MKQPLTRVLPMDHAAWGLRPYPPSYRIYGWMTLTKMWVAFTVQTAQNLVS